MSNVVFEGLDVIYPATDGVEKYETYNLDDPFILSILSSFENQELMNQDFLEFFTIQLNKFNCGTSTVGASTLFLRVARLFE